MSVKPCPFCGSNTADHAYDETSGDLVYRTYTCECGFSFVEVFEYLQTEDEDGNEVGE